MRKTTEIPVSPLCLFGLRGNIWQWGTDVQYQHVRSGRQVIDGGARHAWHFVSCRCAVWMADGLRNKLFYFIVRMNGTVRVLSGERHLVQRTLEMEQAGEKISEKINGYWRRTWTWLGQPQRMKVDRVKGFTLATPTGDKSTVRQRRDTKDKCVWRTPLHSFSVCLLPLDVFIAYQTHN